MPEYKPNESAPVRPIFVTTADKPGKQLEDNESNNSLRKGEKRKEVGILKSIWRGLAGG
jgi:hypothetical protein